MASKKGSANMLKAEMANLNLEAMKSLDARRQHHGKPRLPWRNGPSSLQQSWSGGLTSGAASSSFCRAWWLSRHNTIAAGNKPSNL